MSQKPKQLLRIPMKYVRDIELGTLHGKQAINIVLPANSDIGPLLPSELDDLISDLQAIRRTYLQ